MFKHSIKDNEQFTHTSSKGDLLGFTSSQQSLIEGTYDRVMTGGYQCSHIEGGTDTGAATPNCTFPAQCTTIPVERSYSSQCSYTLSIQGSQFRQVGQEGDCQLRPYTRHRSQQVFLFTPYRAVMHHPAGLTLEQIGSRFGITRERVRKLIAKHYGSSGVRELLTITDLARLTGCTWKYIDNLRQRGVIQPAMVVGCGRTLWKPETIATIIMYVDRHRCPVCGKAVPSNRQVYCSRECYLEARRYKNKSEEAKRQHNESVKQWLTEHLEKAKQIRQRAQAKWRAKKAPHTYQTAQYVIWRRCIIPLGTVVRVLSHNSTPGRVIVEWQGKTVEVPFGCVKRMEKEAVAAK